MSDRVVPTHYVVDCLLPSGVIAREYVTNVTHMNMLLMIYIHTRVVIRETFILDSLGSIIRVGRGLERL